MLLLLIILIRVIHIYPQKNPQKNQDCPRRPSRLHSADASTHWIGGGRSIASQTTATAEQIGGTPPCRPLGCLCVLEKHYRLCDRQSPYRTHRARNAENRLISA